MQEESEAKYPTESINESDFSEESNIFEFISLDNDIRLPIRGTLSVSTFDSLRIKFIG